MIVLNVYYKAKPGKRQEYFDRVCAAGVPEKSRAEAGNIGYDYYFSDADKNLLLLVEHWKDQDAFDFHKNQAHFKELGGIKEEYVEETRIERFEIE